MQSRLQILNEIYFGKTPEILKIENTIKKFRQKYTLNQNYDAKMMKDPLRYELSKNIEDAFGFEIAEVTIEPSSTLNACTFPIGYKLDTIPSKNLIVSNKNGFRYKPEAGYAIGVFINAGLLLHPDFSAGEITAILLHEIGHNFTPAVFLHQGIFGKIRILSKIVLIAIEHGIKAGVVNSLYATNFTTKSVAKINKYLEINWPNFSVFISAIDGVFGVVKDLRQFYFELISAFNPITNALYSAMNSLLSVVLDPISILIGNTDENFADSFAAMYGYSEELSTALAKMSSRATMFRSALKESSLLNNLYHTSLIPMYFVLSVFDEHSQTCVRSAKLLETLNYEVQNGNYSPKFKKRIKQDIVKTKKSLDDAYYKINNNNDPEAAQKIWAQFVLANKCYKLYDLILNQATPENVDKNIRKNLINNVKFK